MKSEELRYEADGLSMIGRFTWDETATSPRPGVLVFPEAFGLGEHAIGRGERLTRSSATRRSPAICTATAR